MQAAASPDESISAESAAQPPRRWPALALVALGGLLYLTIYLFILAPDSLPPLAVFMTHMWGPALMTALLGAWWLLLGPAPRRTRWTTSLLAVLVAAGAGLAADSSIRNFMIFKGIPATAGLVALFLCICWRLRPAALLGGALAIGVLTLLPWTLLRCSQGVTGTFGIDAQWRWSASAEEAAAAFDQGKQTAVLRDEPAPEAGANDWPGFRGARRDGVAAASPALPDTPPRELWRRPVGPGWSSLCVVGDRLWTQEQRGDDELVACYRAGTGELLWSHADRVRYGDAMSGSGPRATPTYHEGKLYTLGGTGILNCLDAMTGRRIWTADLKKATADSAPPFGFAASPLVLGNQVIVLPGSPRGARALAYDAATGREIWQTGTAAVSYCSPQLATLAGVPQLLLYTSEGLFAHEPATGAELWQYSWPNDETAASVVQPLVLPDERIVLGGGRVGIGSRCIKPTLKDGGWSTTEEWRSPFSPGFNDMERFGSHLYGLEAGRLVCMDGQTGQRVWKDGRYGTGQLLRVGDKLLVLAESGQAAVVQPSPAAWQELLRFPALSDKTWNHPVIAQGRLFVRNGREMACFQLAP